MRTKILLGGLFLLAVGCASNKEMLNTSIAEAEGMQNAAAVEKIKSPATVQGEKSLLQAKQFAEEGKIDLAMDAAEKSRLQYRVAFAEKEAKDAALADETAARELLGDEEQQKLYQSILENETKGKESAAKLSETAESANAENQTEEAK